MFKTDGTGWRVRQGQALWRPRRGLPEIAGELALATDPQGRSVVQFTKAPVSMVSAQCTPERWRIEFPPRALSFSGRAPPPARFLWLALPAALSGQPLPKSVRFEREPDRGWVLENPRSGESLKGFLEP